MSAELFRIEETLDSPLVVIKPDLPQVIIKGVSMPENAFEFYFPIETRILELLKNMGEQVELEIELVYLNSMSGKQLLQLIRKIDSAKKNFKVLWKYQAEDDLLRIKGEDLKRICPTVAIEVIPIVKS